MLGLTELKKHIVVTEDTVECPVKGCTETVERQRKIFRYEDRFKCPRHRICISPSTFEYESMWDNLIWKDRHDKELWANIRRVKRESRIARDNSEDAVTWNVFRFLERGNLLSEVLSRITNENHEDSQIIYWSYSPDQDAAWNWLVKAREEFELVPSKGSEPDIITVSDKAVFFIEAKLNADNKTKPSNLYVSEKYQAGGDNWFNQVFVSHFDTVAVRAKKYELMRFWLLGSWIAKQLNLDFYLVNLVRSQAEQNIETEFLPHIRSAESRAFLRLTWEQIFSEVLRSEAVVEGRDAFEAYFRNKSIGYADGELQAAFEI